MRKRQLRGRKSTCSSCGQPKEPNRIKYGYCLACHNRHMRLTRPTHSEMTPEQRMKANARSYLHVYIKRGHIVKPDHCFIENCPNTKLEAHHSDHSKPLEVVWLCQHHHQELTNLKKG